MVTTPDGLVELLEELADVECYAFDTEFHRERTYFARLALLQLAWPGGSAIIDPLAVDPAPLAALFGSDALAIVHAGEQDLEIIERACGVLPERLFDTQLAAGFIGLASPSLGALVDRLLGLRLEKGDQLTDWLRRPLSETQLHYAAGDVEHLIECYEALRARLVALGRWEWAMQECAELAAKHRRVPDPDEAWWRLRQARQLRGKARGVAQRVAAWRELRAQQLDVPIRTLLNDLAIVSIAQRPPSSRNELEAVRTIDGRHLANGGAQEILAAVEEGLRLPVTALRLPPGPQGEPVARPAVQLAAAYAAERARVLEFDPAVLATRADIAEFLREPPSGRLVTTWRRELIGAEIRLLVDGKAALAFEGGALSLEERSHRPLEELDGTGESA